LGQKQTSVAQSPVLALGQSGYVGLFDNFVDRTINREEHSESAAKLSAWADLRVSQTKLCTDQRGTTAIEFALVGPVLLMALIGIFYLCMGLAVVGGMHYAVEEGARCAAVKTLICTDQTSTVTYTQNHYFAPGALPTFTYDPAAACGRLVTGSLSYVLDLGFAQYTVPMTAAACFP
jgi:hypothetical protein